jgi:hypothetical protein
LLFQGAEFGMVVAGVSVAAGYRTRQPFSRGFARRSELLIAFGTAQWQHRPHHLDQQQLG